MSAIAAAPADYLTLAFEARRRTVETLQPIVGEFTLTEWSNRALEAMWSAPAFPWDKIRRQIRDPDRVDIAIWVGKRLVGMGICVSKGDAIKLEFIEGDPDPDCPMVGRRTLIFLDVAANYAQARGKRRLLVQPMNSGLVNYYQKFGFSPFPKNTGSPYMWKKV